MFSSRQAYTFIKGHYIPFSSYRMFLMNQYWILDKRKYYIQNYEFTYDGILNGRR